MKQYIGLIQERIAAHIQANTLVLALGKNASLVNGLNVQKIIVQPRSYFINGLDEDTKLYLTSHPMIEENTVTVSKSVRNQINKHDGELLVIVTGGASAALAIPRKGLTVNQYNELVKEATQEGWKIAELNQLRVLIDEIKGGGLIQHLNSKVMTLVVSDVISDDPRIVGSGPTMGGISISEKVIKRVVSRIGEDIVNKYRDDLTDLTSPVKIIGNRKEFIELLLSRINAKVVDINLEDDIKVCSEYILGNISHGLQIFVGEWTINIENYESDAQGGRLSAMMIELARGIDGDSRTRIVGIASDGKDGNSPDSAYWIDGETAEKLQTWDSVILSGNSGLVLHELGLSGKIETTLNILDYIFVYV